jgi:tetratricopeptide (TPR) repeat protein
MIMMLLAAVIVAAALIRATSRSSGNRGLRTGVWRRARYAVCVLALPIAALSGQHAAAEAPVNLLTLPQAKLETVTPPGDAASKLNALVSGNAGAPVELETAGARTVGFVYGFDGGMVAPEAVAITLAEQSGAPPEHIEVLASTVSPHTGFRSLRTDPVDASKTTQKFVFTPAGAHWIMVRLTAGKPGGKITLAGIEVLGHPGAPVSPYAFNETPARIIDILSRLESSGSVDLAVSGDEKLAFQKAKAGQLSPAEFADTALLASGVLDPARRKAYLGRIDELEAKAVAAVGQIADPTARGAALLKWLHREALGKGYEGGQTSLSVLLDRQTFNCVSSAAIYTILAQRLGLDARAIEVPDHAFSIVYQDTDHMDVETTNAEGFNPSRDPGQIAKFEKLTGFHYIPESHRDERREITGAGLAALIYYNRGVDLGNAKRHREALLAYFRAMSLDSEFASAAKNALATLANWGLELSEEGKWQQAIDVTGLGLTLAPKDALLANNRDAIWNKWAMSLAAAGRPDEGIAVLKRAAAAVPDGGFEPMQAWVYIKPGEDLVKAHDWKGALTATEAGLSKLDPIPLKELVEWRDNLFVRWTNSEIDSERFDSAASVLEAGLGAKPDAGNLLHTVSYLGQEWAKKASTESFAKGMAVLSALEQKFPAAKDLKDIKESYVWRHVSALAEADRMADALAAVEEARDFLASKEESENLAAFVFDTSGKAKMKASAWDEAAGIYARALEQYPGNSLLKNNVSYLAQEWQKAAFAKGGLPEVNTVSEALAARFPALEEIKHSGGEQIQRTVSEHVHAANFSTALELLKTAASQLNADDLQKMNELIYDNWAKQRMAAKDWAGAADVYAAALTAASSSNLLRNNAVYLAQEWARAGFSSGGLDAVIQIAGQVKAKFPSVEDIGDGPAAIAADAAKQKIDAGDFTAAIAIADQASEILPADRKSNMLEFSYNRWAKGFMDKKQWDSAIGIYDQGLARLPGNSLLTHNREYCLAQKK